MAQHATAVAVLVLVAPLAFAQADLTVTAEWDPNCDPCTAGQRQTLVNTVTNTGPDPDLNVQVQMATAVLGTTAIEDTWTTNQGSYVASYPGNVVRIDSTGLVYSLEATLGVMTPDTTATLTYDVDLDMDPPPVSDFAVNSPYLAPILGLFSRSRSTKWPRARRSRCA